MTTSWRSGCSFQRTDPPFAYLELGQAQVMLEQQHAGGWNVEPLDRPLGRGINFQIEVVDVQSTAAALSAQRDSSLMRFAQPLGRRTSKSA